MQMFADFVVWYFRLEKRWKYHEWANQLSWRRGWGGKNAVTGPPPPMRPLSFPRFLVSETMPIHFRVRKILSVVSRISNLVSKLTESRLRNIYCPFSSIPTIFKHCFFLEEKLYLIDRTKKSISSSILEKKLLVKLSILEIVGKYEESEFVWDWYQFPS